MSDALDQSRGELNRQWDRHIGGLFGRAQYITNAVEALVNAILDAREAKAEPDFDEEVRALDKGKWEPVPDPRDARIAELERERDRAIIRATNERLSAQPGAREAAIRALVMAADAAVNWLHGERSVVVRTNLKAALAAARAAGITGKGTSDE